MSLTTISEWHFLEHVQVPANAADLLVPGKQALVAFKTVRDLAIFTNKRLIVRDAQGLTGRKVETYSLPYSAINMWSTENAGTLDLTGEVELWTRAGHIKIKVGKQVNINDLDRIIATSVLGA